MKDYVPYSWISLSQVKREHYKALAHFYVAVGLLEHHGDHFSTRAEELLQVRENKHFLLRKSQGAPILSQGGAGGGYTW